MTNQKKNDESGTPEVGLERLFRELGGEGSIAVTRNEPDWAKGHIRTVQANPGDPISMDWLTAKFGGAKLRVRVYAADGKPMGSRTVEICAPPRDGMGIELVRGPEGNAVPVNRLDAERRRYNQINGIENTQLPAAQLPAAAPPPAPPIDFTQMFAAMITQQNQANQAMMAMFVNRIQHLESIGSGTGPPVATSPVEPADPLGNLTNVVKVIGELDAVKEKMGISDREPPSETAGYLDLIKGFMEMHVEKKRAEVAQMGAGQPAAQLAQGQPGVPPPNPYQQGAPPNVPKPTPEQLIPLVKEMLPQYLENATRAERVKMASLVLGEQIYDDMNDEPEDDFDDGTNGGNNPPPVENQFPDGQIPQNPLDLDIHDETGDEHEDPVDSCTPPPNLEPPPVPPE